MDEITRCSYCNSENLNVSISVTREQRRTTVYCYDCGHSFTYYSNPECAASVNPEPRVDEWQARAEKAEVQLNAYQKGHNFADKLPEAGERVLFNNWNGHFMLLTFEVNLNGNCLFHDDLDKRHSYDIADTRFEYRWFPLPDTSEDND